MRITAQEEYGLRCLVQLARQKPDEPLTLKQISEREGISPANAGKVLWILGNAGFVQSVRGVKGGYVLARPAQEIAVSEVISVFEGEGHLEEHCRSFPGTQDVCVHNSDCGIRPVLQSLHAAVNDVLSRITLAQLVSPEPSDKLVQINRSPNRAEAHHATAGATN